MKHDLYSVLKHPAPVRGLKWAVQMSTGIICFRIKKDAQKWATACITADAGLQHQMIEADLAINIIPGAISH